MSPKCIWSSIALTFFLEYSSSSTLSRIIGHPYHSPPWSNEEELEVNLRQMERKRATEREKFERRYGRYWREDIAVTVTESPEAYGLGDDDPGK